MNSQLLILVFNVQEKPEYKENPPAPILYQVALGLGYLELPQGSLAVLFWSFYLFSSQLFIDLIFYVLYSGYPWRKVDDQDAGNQKCLYLRLSFRDLCLVRENLVKNPVPWFFFLFFFFFSCSFDPSAFS